MGPLASLAVVAVTPLVVVMGVGQPQSSNPDGAGDDAPEKARRITRVVREKGGYTGELPVRKGGPAPQGDDGVVQDKVVQVQLQAVEQAVGDLGPLEHPLRDVEQGIELPMGFFKVYQVPGYDRNATSLDGQPERRFMRASGGLAALYNRSNYIPTKRGLLPDVPESTIWVIGGVPLSSLPGHGMLLPVDPLDPDKVPEPRDAAQPPLPEARADGDHVGFGNAPESMWIAHWKHKALETVEVEEDGPAEASPTIRFLEDQAYRRARLQRLLESHQRMQR